MENRNYEDEAEIDLVELFKYLIRKWPMLLAGIIAGVVIAGAITFFQRPVYESESMLYILSKTTSITSVADLQLGNALSNDFVIIATSKPVVDTAIAMVAETTGVVLDRKTATNMITVKNETNTRLLKITVQSEDPVLACELANAVTEATASQMAEIMKSDPPTTVERAEVALEANSRGMKRNLIIGALAGLVLVAAIYIIIMLADDKIKTPEDIEKYLGETVLGTVPLDRALERADKKRKNEKK